MESITGHWAALPCTPTLQEQQSIVCIVWGMQQRQNQVPARRPLMIMPAALTYVVQSKLCDT